MENKFTQNDTKVIKGIAIIMLLFHHLFYSAEAFNVSANVRFLILDQSTIIAIAQVCKVCVAIFVFITAYGMTIKLKSNLSKIERVLIERISKLMIPFIFVYCLSFVFCLIKDYTFIIETYGKGWRSIIWILLDSMGMANIFGTPTLNETWWYMALAVSLVICIPILYSIYKKIGITILFFPPFLTYFLGLNPNYFNWYALPIFLGIFAADYSLFEKCNPNHHTVLKTIIYGILIVCLGIVRSNLGFVNIIDGIMALLIILLVWNAFAKIKFINKFLSLIGKNSFNIFLVHTFIYQTFYKEVIYSFELPIIILGVLLVISLIISIIIEKLKTLCKLNSLILYTIKSYEKRFNN